MPAVRGESFGNGAVDALGRPVFLSPWARIEDMISDQSVVALSPSVKAKKSELIYLAAILQWLKPGGRAGVVVPEAVLFGRTRAHQDVLRMLVEEYRVDGVVSSPAGAFQPYTGRSTSILLLTKKNSRGQGSVWFYDLTAASATSPR